MDMLRISDADRDAAMELLSEHYSLGRLTKDEFDERADAVWSAKTRSDLSPVFADLPVSSPSPPKSAGGAPPSPRRRWPIAPAPVLFLLIALTVITHLPFVLLALVVWFAVGRGRGRWGHGPHHYGVCGHGTQSRR
jgi:hypothetical protein